ncbi:MAG: SAM-dependent chlorinase/fluorinase [Ktedonobacteraceae bacterium]|nr:SAM-dependent chlorinase/fluorinase [Ktedonobacteraceae bacterium]
MKKDNGSEHPVIAFLTDFGLRDGYAGMMKGVILGLIPQVQLVDVTHMIPPQDIAAGAWVLATAYRYFPAGTVFVCVVDPGVGSTRRPVALRAGDWIFVGPDNGLFTFVLLEQPVHEVVALENRAYHLAGVSTTFHGRDIFSPVAAHIARGTGLAELGSLLDPATLVRLEIGFAVRRGHRIEGRILHVDHFGNLITNIPLRIVPELFEAPVVRMILPAQGVSISTRRRFFAAAGNDDMQPFIYSDSSGCVAIAVRNESAARLLKAGYGTAVTLIVQAENQQV